jgi:hypothetical protein
MTLSVTIGDARSAPLQIPEGFGKTAVPSPSEAVIANAMRLRQIPISERQRCVGEVGVVS